MCRPWGALIPGDPLRVDGMLLAIHLSGGGVDYGKCLDGRRRKQEHEAVRPHLRRYPSDLRLGGQEPGCYQLETRRFRGPGRCLTFNHGDFPPSPYENGGLASPSLFPGDTSTRLKETDAFLRNETFSHSQIDHLQSLLPTSSKWHRARVSDEPFPFQTPSRTPTYRQPHGENCRPNPRHGRVGPIEGTYVGEV